MKINEESNYVKHARKEFEFTGWTKNGIFKDDMQEDMCNQVLELLSLFSEHGHSGSTYGYAINLFKKLADFKPIGGIKGTDDEFGTEVDANQNMRCGTIFRDIEGCYYIDAIVWRDQNNSCFTSGGVEGIGSSQYIKEFPFTPKTFYIDVISTEWADKEETEKKKGGGWWTHKIKDKKQLDVVWTMYNKRGE